MSFFKKKGVEIVDLTDMEKRGLLEKSKKISGSSGDMIDFSSKSENLGNPAGDFLSNLAGVGNTGSVTDSLRTARKRNIENSELNEMRLKMDDNDFKLNSLIERVKELERKLDER